VCERCMLYWWMILSGFSHCIMIVYTDISNMYIHVYACVHVCVCVCVCVCVYVRV